MTGEPLYGFLVGRCERDPFTEYFGFRVDAEMTPEAVTDYCLAMKEAHGSTMFEGKLILVDPVAEIETVKQLRGPSAMICLDSNMQWSLNTAIRVLREIEPGDIRNYEDPVATSKKLPRFADIRRSC